MTYMGSASTTPLPELPALVEGLQIALGSPEAPAHEVQVLERQTNVFSSSMPSEFITCRLADGQEVRLFCKYTGEDFDSRYGHRQDVGFEGEVYRRILNPLGASAPYCYGTYHGAGARGGWMFLEAIDGAERVTKTSDPAQALVAAAKEIGRFHRIASTPRSLRRATFLSQYRREYYLGWVTRTVEFARPWHERFPWLMTVSERSVPILERLLAASHTVIHGEFYPNNIIYRDGVAFLLDWQSTAIAPGEIDLAALTDSWPDDVVAQCTQAYARSRWPNGAPVEFESTLQTARLYLTFRWLGDRPEWTTGKRQGWRFEQLHQLATRLGLLSEDTAHQPSSEETPPDLSPRPPTVA